MLEFFQTLSWAAVFQIILIDILLGGDNAVVIALACRNLEPRRRMQGILWGTFGAIILRIALVAFALTLLTIPYLKIVGGLLLVWIGVKMLVPEDENPEIQGGSSIASAVRTIIIADFIMSIDNVVAIAAAAQNSHADHQVGLVAFGLIVSVPIIVWGSTLVLKLIDRFPIVVTFGAGLLGWIAGGMISTDVAISVYFSDVVGGVQGEVPRTITIAAEVVGALLVIVAGRVLAARQRAESNPKSDPASESAPESASNPEQTP